MVQLINAYNSINEFERQIVDSFIKYASEASEKQNCSVLEIMQKPLPQSIIAESRGAIEKPLVQAAIVEKLNDVENARFLDKNRIIKEHNLLAFSNMADYVKINQYNQPEIALENLSREKMAAIQKIKITNTLLGTTIELKLYDKQNSLQFISKLVNLEQVERVKEIDNTANMDADAQYQQLIESLKQ